MIFLTVGTHEQQFNRIIEYMDNLKRDGIIEDDIIMQIGFSTYKPQFCSWEKLFSYEDMKKNVEDAKIVITHGGPSSFIMPLQIGKIPIVVPRQYKFNEHVNNHQLDFCKIVEKRNQNIIVVEEINQLKDVILNYTQIIGSMPKEMTSNNAKFCKGINEVAQQLLEKRH